MSSSRETPSPLASSETRTASIRIVCFVQTYRTNYFPKTTTAFSCRDMDRLQQFWQKKNSILIFPPLTTDKGDSSSRKSPSCIHIIVQELRTFNKRIRFSLTDILRTLRLNLIDRAPSCHLQEICLCI